MRVLVLQHIACEHPGTFSAVMAERGVEAVPVELDEGQPLPDWRRFDGVLAMGGPMGVDDEAEHPWLADEKRLIGEAVRAGTPFLGVCLGVQLLAAALGAPVSPAPAPEVGLLPVHRTEAGRADSLLGGLEEPLVTLQWHGDTFGLPEGAVALATSPLVRNQAFRWGDRAYGIQFHLEVTPAMTRRWAQVPAYRKSLADTLGEAGGHRFLAEAEARAPELRVQGCALFAAWLELVAAPRPAAAGSG
jgi:GMP synthase-like glutamine amidotransferase